MILQISLEKGLEFDMVGFIGYIALLTPLPQLSLLSFSGVALHHDIPDPTSEAFPSFLTVLELVSPFSFREISCFPAN